MMNMHSKYDNIHRDGMNYTLKCTINHVISSINCMLLVLPNPIHWLWRLLKSVIVELDGRVPL